VLDRREFLVAAAGLGLAASFPGARAIERRLVSGKTIALALWDGVEELDLVGPYEVLTAWAFFAPEQGARVLTVADRRGEVRAAHGLRLLPDTTWGEIGDVGVLVLPGGNTGPQLSDARFLERLRKLAAGGTLMTSVCTGALAFAAAGLLEGKAATTHWSALESLSSYGNIEVRRDERFVDEGSVITAAGVSAGIDMALHLVARLDSVARAREVRRYIQYDPEPPV
jgi:transcriptional regulator GlxA family with amidase domain